jgi:transposase
MQSLKKPRRRLTHDEKVALVKDYRDGLSMQEIISKYGVGHRRRVTEVVTAFGFTPRPRGRPGKNCV